MPPKEVTSGPSSTAIIPTSYKVASATLSFVAKAADPLDPLVADNWQQLDKGESKGPRDANVGQVLFDYNVSITQKSKVATCTLKLNQQQYSNPTVQPTGKPSDPLRVAVCRGGEYTLSLEGDQEAAKELPLAKHCDTFAWIRLMVLPGDLTSSGGTKAKTMEGRAGHLRALLTGHDLLDIQGRWNSILSTDRECLLAETEAQQAQLGMFKDCRIKTKAGGRSGRNVIVEVYAPQPTDPNNNQAAQVDYDSLIGSSYWLKAPQTFPTDQETLKKHKIFGASMTDGWDLVSTKNVENSRAAFVGMISNSFGSEGVAGFVDKEEANVSLEPIFYDIQGDRARAAVGAYASTLNEESKRLHGFFTEPETVGRPKTKLPVNMLFGNFNCNDDENRLAPVDSQISADVAAKLNPSQLRYARTALVSRVSTGLGPPGTGKSSMTGALTYDLVANKQERIAATAVTNVAVDSLLDSCVKMWHELDPNTPAPFARVYSAGQIKAQWSAGDLSTLEHPYHIDQLRHQLASQNREAYASYLRGREELKEHGNIADEEVHKAYSKQCKSMNKYILGTSVRVVFCTVASCQTPALYEEDPANGDLKWYFKATTIIVDEAGTIERPFLMMLCVAFPDSQRLVLAGDPFQLPAFKLSETTKTYWPRCYLEDIIRRKFPCVMLQRQYRMHDQMYEHLVDCIYKEPILSERLTSEPSAFLQNILDRSIHVETLQNMYKLRSFLHFLDVPNGAQESHEGGTSWNEEEAVVVNGLIKGLLAIGIKKSEICVMTGYRGQKKLLGRVAKENGWVDVKRILTIDSSQVCTGGRAGFMGDRPRANVGTSRQREALYFVGQGKYWLHKPELRKVHMHSILEHMQKSAPRHNRPDFVVISQAYAPAHEDLATTPVARGLTAGAIEQDLPQATNEVVSEVASEAIDQAAAGNTTDLVSKIHPDFVNLATDYLLSASGPSTPTNEPGNGEGQTVSLAAVRERLQQRHQARVGMGKERAEVRIWAHAEVDACLITEDREISRDLDNEIGVLEAE